jgi:lactate dehydrogenase-like 2-hydroxyacid dehydrogenase
MKVLAERAGVQDSEIRLGRVLFEETVISSSVLFLACPLNVSTASMISELELRLMRPDAILIIVTRGGIVAEDELVKTLKEKWIAGAGLGDFAVEPADKDNSTLIAEGSGLTSLVLSPHVAWHSKSSIGELRDVTRGNIEG